MIVEQPEAFKSWLTAVLKPMCDADPAALAKYVIALIKKDKADDELRKSMVGQLEVFLEEETETFVSLVFQTLQSQEYMTTPVIPNANPPNPNIVKKDKDNSAKEKVIVQPSELPNLSEQINGSKKEAELKRDREVREIRKPDINENKDKDEKARTVRRRDRSSSRDRLRSRSRSWDRSKRSRSRDKSRDRVSPTHRGGGVEREKRERLPRIWRNKSPPLRSRYERRRSRTPPSPSRSPRYQHRAGRYRNRSLDRSRSRSRSRSIDKPRRDSAKDKDREHSRPGTPTQDSNHGEPDLRLTTSTQSVQSCVVLSTKRKCRDFDEKGLCMRGEMCPFDHGVDPVVLEDAALSTVLNYNPNGTTPEIQTNIPPPIIPPPGHPMMGPRGVIPSEYNPQAPFLRGFRGPRPLGPTRLPSMGMFPPPPSLNRELISVPVMDNKQTVYTPGYPPQGNFIPMDNHHDPFYHQKKNKFDFNRLGARPPRNMANCSLELKKIPAGLNSITHLNNHFSKFGKITNIQVNYEGDTEAAIVTFSSHAEASAAYRSTEAVLNNRFIKVFWHNSNNDGKQENTPPRSVKERLGMNQIIPSNTNKVLNLVQPKAEEPGLIPPGSEGTDVKNHVTEMSSQSKEEAKAQAAANIKKTQELLAAKEKLKKNQDDKRKEVMKINQDLRKRKQELLEKQLSQQKILIEKMEKLPPGPQRDLIKETIKKTQESIEAIRKDVAQSIASKMAVPPKKTKEDAQKEMLDIELDLISKQQEGVDVTEIQRKYFELKAKTAMLRRGRGRRFNPIQRHSLSKNNLIDNAVKTATKIDRTNSNTSLHASYPNKLTTHAIDNRPIRILVSGYEIEEQENVVAHFQQFGEIAEYITDPTLPSVTFNFKNRKDAEAALLKGKHFQDRTLSITWCSNLQHSNQLNNNLTRKVVMSENEEEQLIDQTILEGDEEANGTEQELPEEVLLQDDDEDDDEDRSWRR